MISTSTPQEVQQEVFIVGRKRRRQRKRSRKKSKGKVGSENEPGPKPEPGLNVNEVIPHEDVEEYLEATCTTNTNCPEEGIINVKSEDGDTEEKQCGCQTSTLKDSTEGQKRRRRRHRSRNKRKSHTIDQQMNDMEADLVKHIEEECYRFQTPDFVAPAFKVHQRCKHPNYSSRSGSALGDASQSNAQLTSLNETCKSKGKLVVTKRKEKKTSAKTKAQLEEAKAVEKQNRKLKQMQQKNGNAVGKNETCSISTGAGNVTPVVQSVSEISVPVNSIEELNVGDIFYFNQLILKGSEPTVELTKAKVFMKMLSPGENKPNAILFRTFAAFDALSPATWWSGDDQLSAEPFIIKFQDMSQVRKHIDTDL